MKKILLIGICSLTYNAWGLEARLTPNPIMQGESAELVISSDKPLSPPKI